MFYFGAISVAAFIILIGVLSGKNAKSGFGGARTSGSLLVTGALFGTFIGGSSTIGTAQLAFSYGLSGWWYTLGGAVGVLLLGLVFLKPVYNDPEVRTVADIIGREYGKRNGVLAAVLSSLGILLSFVAQILSASALLMSVFPLSFNVSVIISAVLIILYVFFGGILALGRAGLAKTALIGISVVICAVTAVVLSGGPGIYADPAEFPRELYFNLFARGFAVDGGAALSVLLGVITTQSYLGAFLAAKTLRKARGGAVITAIFVPVIGICAAFIGMYMKAFYPDLEPKLSLPTFIVEKMPPVVGGMMIAALFITVIGSAAGIAMGMSSIIYKNIFRPLALRKRARNGSASCDDDREAVVVSRICLLGIVLAGCAICYADLGSLIITWTFLSMGLRAAVAFIPMIASLFLPGRIKPVYATVSMAGSVIVMIAEKLIFPDASVDPLVFGLAFSLITMAAGYITGRKNTQKI